MTKLKLIVKKLTLALTLMALLSSPFAVLAQETTSEADEANRRKEAAAVLKAEAEARKAAADAALVEAQITEKNATTRKTQLDLLKTNSEVSGNLAENGIAASKAIGCAAVSIANEVDRVNMDKGTIETLVLHSPAVAELMSQYSALYGEISTMNARYSDSVDRLNNKLNEIENGAVAPLLKKLQFLEKERTKIEFNSRFQINAAGLLELKGLTKSDYENQLLKNDQETTSTKASLTAMGVGGLDPYSAAIGVALDLFALFKTDTTVTGTDVKPGALDLTGYLFRLLNLQADKNLRISKRLNTIAIISPDHFVLTRQDYANSELINSLDELSVNYQSGKGASSRADSLRKKAVDAAKIKHAVESNENQVKMTTQRVELALNAYAANPNSLALKAKYEEALNAKRVAQIGLDTANKRVEQEVANSFDAKIRAELKSVERMNGQAEKMSNRFNDTSDAPAAPKKLIGDFLKGEVLAKRMAVPSTLWLETAITSAGANQRKQSSPIIDVFTRGPILTYSGGAVVSYQIRRLDSTILTAGTVWAHAPYQRSKNIEKFVCTGIDIDGDPIRKYNL